MFAINIKNGRNFAAIGLPLPIDNGLYFNDGPNLEQEEELDFDKLNNEQREMVDSVLLEVHGGDRRPRQPDIFMWMLQERHLSSI